MRRKGYLAIFIWLLITVNFIVPISVKVSNNITDQVKSASLEVHSPIMINGNTELDAFCSGNGTDGLTLETAHVIEGYEINSGGSGSGITINNTDRFLIIRNVTTVRGGSEEEDSGINLFNSEKITVTMSNIENNTNYGIWMLNSQYINITGNYFMNNSYGIYSYNSSNNFISNNTVTFQGGSGIYLDLSNNNTIIGNNASYNSDSGIYLYDASDNNIISNNTASFNWEGIYVEFTENNTIIGNNASYNAGPGVEDYESNNTVVNGNWLTYNDYSGISMWGGDSGNYNSYFGNNIANNGFHGIVLDDKCTNTTIVENNISNNGQHGIFVTDESNGNTISGNNISNNGENGIYMNRNSKHNIISRNNFIDQTSEHVYADSNSDNTTISYNFMNGSSSYAVYVYESNSTTIYNNTILDASYGIYISYGINHNISSNYIENVGQGIYFEDSDYNIVANNIIKLCDYGIYASDSHNFLIMSNVLTNLISEAIAIDVGGSINGSVVGNFIAHNRIGFYGYSDNENITVWLNYFYNNSFSEAMVDDSGVAFDNGTIGNYWGDYVSRYPNATNDGIIWNTEYQVNTTSYNDSYPLVSPGNPSIAPSNNITYMEGDTGNLISWNITDTIVLDPSFSIFRNNILDGTGVWNSGVPIEVDVDGLDAGNHTFLIEISDGTAWGVNRSEIMVTVDEIPSPVIANSSQTILGESFTLGWSSVSGADSYKIYVNGSLNETSISTSQLIMLWTIGTYSITVTAVNGGTESIQSSPIEVTVAILSTPLITTMNQTINSESINVSWGEVAGAGSYNIYVNDDFNETTTNTFQIINLLTNGNYTITVTAVNGSIESEHSTAIMIIVEIDEVIPPNALDGVYISIVVAFAVGFLFFLSMKRQRVE